MILRPALTNPVIAKIMAEPTAEFPGKTLTRQLTAQNELLARYPGDIGGKTGYTDLARKTYVARATQRGPTPDRRADVRHG